MSDESDLVVQLRVIRMVPLIRGLRVRGDAEWREEGGEGGGQQCVVRLFHQLCIGSASSERSCDCYDSIFMHF